ncbi:hypothetical protein Tco_0665829 [Tanacetum coccineum]
MGAAYGSLRATDFAAAAKKDDADDDDTIKWYRDTNAQISVGVPMAPPLPNDDATNGIPTSRVTWEVEPCERHRHMIIELDYPLLETGEAILLSKLTLGVCGSKQVEALQWRTMSFKIPKLRMVEAKGEWVRGRRVYKVLFCCVLFCTECLLSWTEEDWSSAGYNFSLPLSVAAFLRNFENFRNVGDEAVHKELGDRMERAATTASSLEAEQDSGSGPRCQDTILGDVNAQTRFEITSIQSIDPPLSRGYTLGSGEDSMKLIGIDEILLKLVLSVLVSAVKRMLMLPVQVSAIEEKPKESDGFAEIIDFLKASSVSYALTVNPVIYTSCIEQFWATAKVQTVNGVRQLQALVDKKRVIVTESSIRRDLHLDDAEGTDCLPTATIFEELARMGYEKPSQKLTFYKAFFSPQWKYYIHTIT